MSFEEKRARIKESFEAVHFSTILCFLPLFSETVSSVIAFFALFEVKVKECSVDVKKEEGETIDETDPEKEGPDKAMFAELVL